MQVKVLGAGCANCHALGDRADQALRQLGVDGSVELVTDYAQIAGYGVMSTPALVVEGHVVMSGRVPEVRELVSILADSLT
ncbi:MAG: redox-active disulfide protein 2 [Actinobacteria bacterium RBG_16_67_15]|nr:MAG: redox-active disulfide protein 2 [Actinobacteria bacterium RBG_16_67_15]